MSDISKKDQEQLAKLGLVLIEKLTKDELRTLSLAHDCGMLDTIFNNQLNPKVADDFPEEFYGDLHPDNDDIVDAQDEKLSKSKKGQTEGYLDIIRGENSGIDERDELEDIDNDDVADKMILEEDDCHLKDVVGEVLTDEARAVLEQSYEEDGEIDIPRILKEEAKKVWDALPEEF